MDAYTTEPFGDSYSGGAPILIAGDSDAALQRAARTVEASGLRIGATVPLEKAAERISLQASASALWVELELDGGASMDRLLDQVSGDVADGRYSAVVAAPSDLVDLVFARVGGHGVELLIDGSDADRAAALAIATSGAHRADRLSDVASAPVACAAVSSQKTCSLILRGTCCSTCSRRRLRNSACRFRACASLPRSRRRRRCAG